MLSALRGQASSSSSSASPSPSPISPSASMSPSNPSLSPSDHSNFTVIQTPATGARNQGPASVSMTSSASPQPNSRLTSRTTDKEKPRLTEQEKKNNHIASEQKRRAAIREGFDRLTELVPGLEGQGRSEGVVLRKTVDFMQMKLQERKELVEEIEKRGGSPEDALRR
ncbi:helix-loop-helix DNA-binding domain-containing protein [Blastomyces gilchristii SLH14081]|uniref:Helix-loop-helix DNA-binding domain-containing protein n=1 Tax=Blastomyces gilchristii (strain SLH14081) TaxID=559298 RepID=A0A179UU92_BLAGS|nr:helix-loop-helix DNA-binding domain-containing protein [Blastomyces gilchristii SLH14081]OAT10637.1 helix-loop-helix DNA-binding domain-containing protein [Blastomyces gilchristii SLH14081]